MRGTYRVADRASRTTSRELARFLVKEGQFLLPMVELVEQAEYEGCGGCAGNNQLQRHVQSKNEVDRSLELRTAPPAPRPMPAKWAVWAKCAVCSRTIPTVVPPLPRRIVRQKAREPTVVAEESACWATAGFS
jgi:hypothetical protein